MSRRRFVQLLAGFADGDAISNESRSLHGYVQQLGYEAQIYVADGRIAPTMESQCRPLSAYSPERDDVLLHHYAVSSPATERFLAASGRKILLYHNITPPEFFRGYDDELAGRLTEARAGLRDVASACSALWADSQFDADELTALGLPGVRVLPLIFSPSQFDVPADARVRGLFAEPMRNILFVGRMAPNKCVEELIEAFAWYRTSCNRRSRLLIVGSKHSAPRYYAMLRMFAAELDLENVHFEGFASEAGLSAYYEVADLFVCPSRHEGYCLPLVEAMFKGVPVIARATGGTPEAMGGAGVLYEDLSPAMLAELMHRTLEDGALHAEVLASQQRRADALRARQPMAEVKRLLDEALARG